MDIRIPSLLRIKPNALYKLGKYLRKNGFHRIALFYGEGMADLVGKNVAISLDSSEIDVVSPADRARQRRRRRREQRVRPAARRPGDRRGRRRRAPSTSGSTPGSSPACR